MHIRLNARRVALLTMVHAQRFGRRWVTVGHWHPCAGSGWGADIQKPTGNAQFDVDDLSWAFVRFDNGAVIQLQVSWAVNNKDQFFTEIYGTQGGAWVGDQDKVELYTNLNGQQSDIQVTVPRSGVGSYKHLANNLVRYLDGDPTAEIITPHQALTSVKIIEGVFRSAIEGREVVLDRA